MNYKYWEYKRKSYKCYYVIEPWDCILCLLVHSAFWEKLRTASVSYQDSSYYVYCTTTHSFVVYDESTKSKLKTCWLSSHILMEKERPHKCSCKKYHQPNPRIKESPTQIVLRFMISLTVSHILFIIDHHIIIIGKEIFYWFEAKKANNYCCSRYQSPLTVKINIQSEDRLGNECCSRFTTPPNF